MNRSRCQMYVQKVTLLGFDSTEALYKRAENLNPKPKRIAMITHNKDVDKDGNKIDPHVHLVMEFEEDKRPLFSSIAKQLNDKPEFIENMMKRGKYSTENAFAYLVHATSGAQNKYQYNPEKVKANFDYCKFLEEVKNQSKQSVKQIFEDVSNGSLDGEIAKEILMAKNPLSYHELEQKLDSVIKERRKLDNDTWLKNKIKSGEPLKVIWIYGKNGLGKTVLAIKLAKKYSSDNSYFKSGGNNDYFEGYNDEKSVILDDFRKNSKFPYEDLLKVADPHNNGFYAPSRYHNKRLLLDSLIITSPYSPWDYYNSLNINSEIDQYGQLARRISIVIKMEKKVIYEMDSFNPEVTKEKMANPFINLIENGKTENKLQLSDLLNEDKDVKGE